MGNIFFFGVEHLGNLGLLGLGGGFVCLFRLFFFLLLMGHNDNSAFLFASLLLNIILKLNRSSTSVLLLQATDINTE